MVTAGLLTRDLISPLCLRAEGVCRVWSTIAMGCVSFLIQFSTSARAGLRSETARAPSAPLPAGAGFGASGVEGADSGPTLAQVHEPQAVDRADHHVIPRRRVGDRGAVDRAGLHHQIAQIYGAPLVIRKSG